MTRASSTLLRVRVSLSRRRWIRASIAVAGACSFAGETGSAELQPLRIERDFESGFLWQRIFGRNWRAVWAASAEAPVFDLARLGGGLRARRTVGGFQTRGLVFEAADGRSFTFRGLEKGNFVPAWLDWSPATKLLRDQASGNFPAAHLVAARLARRLGIAMTEPTLGVLPDDARLGEFRAEFAGRAGTLAEYPVPASPGRTGSFGAVEIIDSEELWRRARTGDAVAVNARAYLRARLFDWWVADFDRHPGQWRWARTAGDDGWKPLPEDHDHAFPRYEGIVTALARLPNPWLLRFDGAYPLRGLVNNSRSLDAWLLAGLDRSAWEREAQAFVRRARASDAIDAALSALPVAWRGRAREEIGSVLRARLEGLHAFAMRHYDALAEAVQLHGSDRDDAVAFECHPDGALQLEFRRGEDPQRLRRRLSSAETRRVDVFWYDGRDRIVRVTPQICGIEVVQHRREPRLERGVPALSAARPSSHSKLPRHRMQRVERYRLENAGRLF